MAKKIKIMSWNINGIRAAHKKGFKDWLIGEQPDILGVQEIKACQDQIPEELTELAGYRGYFHSAQRKGYSGVGVFTKIKPRKVDYSMGHENFDQEGRTIVCEFDDFILFNVYFPNGARSDERLQYKMDFYESFLKLVNKHRKDGKNIVFMGDVNTAHKEIDLARPKANINNSGFLEIERAWIDKVLDQGYIDTFRIFHEEKDQYTYWDQKSRARDRNVGWRIDYVFVDKEIQERVKDAFIHAHVMGSDHCPIGILFETGA